MEVQPDFKDLLELFNEQKVEYLIVGAYALAYHGAPRFTGDIDLYVRPTSENAEKIIKALDAFGFASLGLTAEDFHDPHKVVQLGMPPVRIDLITSISGVHWDEAFSGKVSDYFGDVPVDYIGLKEYADNKRASGRKKDAADLEALGQD